MSGFTVSRRGALALSVGGLAAASLPAWARAQPDGLEAFADATVARFMTQFDTPGMALAVVRPGLPPFLKGYGVRTLGQAAPVDARTSFAIASNSKSFTAAALAMLVDKGLLDWEDPVTKHLPEFRMHDPAVTAMMTVRDLLVHRSGLPLGAGDLIFITESRHTPQDAINALQYLRPARGFRAGYAYDNILYIVAGVLIERLTGDPWHRVIAHSLLAPLGMDDAAATRSQIEGDNIAGRHARLGPPVRGMGPMSTVEGAIQPVADAAGGIAASVTDISKWLAVQLAHGVLPNGERLWSAEQAREMWTPQTIMSSSDGPTPEMPTRAVTTTYALGWMLSDYRGERLVAHSGGDIGQVTQTAMLPSRGIGVAVFTNTEDNVSQGVRNALLDHLMNAPAFDWADYLDRRTRDYQQAALASPEGKVDTAPEGGPSLPLTAYAGRYRDPWYGDIVVSMRDGGLWIDFTPTTSWKSKLEPWGPDAFRTRFDSDEDAIVTFAVANGAVTGVTMKALSPIADFSYDYHDLAFVPVR